MLINIVRAVITFILLAFENIKKSIHHFFDDTYSVDWGGSLLNENSPNTFSNSDLKK